MRALRKLNPSQKGTKKFLERYSEKLVCVRYRYDRQERKRFTTVKRPVQPPESAADRRVTEDDGEVQSACIQRRAAARQSNEALQPTEVIWSRSQ